MTGGWLRALTVGTTLFVDGLDRSLYPYITRFLVTLFSGNKNTKNAQLIFTTHDTTLLDANLLRRDQVWFVEKDAEQSTNLYPLLDYREVRCLLGQGACCAGLVTESGLVKSRLGNHSGGRCLGVPHDWPDGPGAHSLISGAKSSYYALYNCPGLSGGCRDLDPLPPAASS